MDDVLHKLLTASEKNLRDLISQELLDYVMADWFVRNPELAAQKELLFQRVYENTCQLVEGLLINLKENHPEFLSNEEAFAIKKEVQLFVHQQLHLKKEEIEEKVRWLNQKKL